MDINLIYGVISAVIAVVLFYQAFFKPMSEEFARVNSVQEDVSQYKPREKKWI